MFWGIDRDSGKVLRGTQVGPGGQAGGTASPGIELLQDCRKIPGYLCVYRQCELKPHSKHFDFQTSFGRSCRFRSFSFGYPVNRGRVPAFVSRLSDRRDYAR
jgi:hypothetical protein